MLKRLMRWILLLMVLVLIAMYFVLSPMIAIHAAGPGSSHIHSSPIHIVAPNFLPELYWRH